MAVESGHERKVVSGDAVLVTREEVQGGPAVLFSHGGFLTMGLFDPLVALTSGTARCVRWDHRGQGASTGGGWGRRDYLERLYADTLTVIDHFQVTSCHWVGHSIGALFSSVAVSGSGTVYVTGDLGGVVYRSRFVGDAGAG